MDGEEAEKVEVKENPAGTKRWYEADISLEEARMFIRTNIRTAARSFIAVGFYLKRVRDKRLYEEGGYGSIWEFAREEYGISKSTASRYMSMNDRFSEDGNSPNISQEYKKFGKSQLQEMLYLTDEQLEQVTPDTYVQEIRAIRKKEIPYIELPGQMELEVEFAEYFPKSPEKMAASPGNMPLSQAEYTLDVSELLEVVVQEEICCESQQKTQEPVEMEAEPQEEELHGEPATPVIPDPQEEPPYSREDILEEIAHVERVVQVLKGDEQVKGKMIWRKNCMRLDAMKMLEEAWQRKDKVRI